MLAYCRGNPSPWWWWWQWVCLYRKSSTKEIWLRHVRHQPNNGQLTKRTGCWDTFRESLWQLLKRNLVFVLYSLVSVLRTCSWLGSVCCFLLSRIFLTESSRPNTWARLLSTATSTRQESGISAAINQRVTWSVRKEEQIQLLQTINHQVFSHYCYRNQQ